MARRDWARRTASPRTKPPAPRSWIVAAAIAAATVCVSPRPAQAVDTIPFTDVRGGLMEVQASVDGRPPVPMLVDTGAGVDVFSTALGRQYVLITGKYASLRLSGGRVDLPVGTIVSLALGGVVLEAPHVGVWSGLDGTGIDGLISATAFRNITATFDFKDHAIVIEDAQTFPERRRAGVRIPLILQDDLGIALGVFARFDFGNGKSGLCEIDTGSQGITLDDTLAAPLGIDLKSASGRKQARIPSIALEGDPEMALAQPTVTFADLTYDCTVGNSFWQARSFTLDLPNRLMYVAPS